MNAISLKELSRSFGPVKAIDGITLDIKKGEIFGLVGPDGAGKTTLMRMLASILEPDSGEAIVAGFSVRTCPEKVKDHIGYMAQRFGLYEELTVLENINFYADVYTVGKKQRAERIDKLLSFSNLTPFQHRLAGKLSGGMKQKLALACSLIHRPDVLLLDEPTNGVDPVSRRDFWRILYDLAGEVTVFVSTSYLDEAERCSQVALINQGKILFTDSPAALKRKFKNTVCEICTDTSEHINNITGLDVIADNFCIYGNRAHAVLKTEKTVNDCREFFEKLPGNFTVRAILPSIEDIFISEVGR